MITVTGRWEQLADIEKKRKTAPGREPMTPGGFSPIATASGPTPTVDAGLNGGLAAVARNVAYFLTAGSCPPDTPSVTALDLRTAQVLWSVLIPQIPCTDLIQAASLLAYDNGFAIRTSDGRLLLYR